jgi:hypothetical protein
MVNAIGSQSLFLEVTVTTTKPAYHYRQLVHVYGNLTYNDVLVDEGLVTLELHDALDRIRAIRTVPANATPSESGTVEIVSIITTDDSGNPKNTFDKGGHVWLKTTVRNNSPTVNKSVLLIKTLFDVDSTPFQLQWLATELAAGTTLTEMVRIDLVGYDGGNWVSTGTATAYASVLSDWASNGGYPYSAEKEADFTITQGGLALASTTPPQTRESSNSSYEASIRLPPRVQLGTFTIIASGYYKGFKDAFGITAFIRDYEMLGDIIFDRKVDIYDVVAVSTAYGTKGGQSLWNPEADLEGSSTGWDPDGEVDIYDVIIVTGKYGTTY